MGKIIKDTIHAAGVDIGIYTQDFENEFISLTDIARYKSDDPTAVIQNWMRNRDVIEFLGLWERLHNPDFKLLEFEGFRKQAGANAFTMSPKKWIEATDAIGIVSKAGRYGGTYAHSDIAMSFARQRIITEMRDNPNITISELHQILGMAELFHTSRSNIVEHISHIYEGSELDETSTCRKFRQVRMEGDRQVTRELPFYNLDMIISLGYRVKFLIATQFHRWATERLKEYMINIK